VAAHQQVLGYGVGDTCTEAHLDAGLGVPLGSLDRVPRRAFDDGIHQQLAADEINIRRAEAASQVIEIGDMPASDGAEAQLVDLGQ